MGVVIFGGSDVLGSGVSRSSVPRAPIRNLSFFRTPSVPRFCWTPTTPRMGQPVVSPRSATRSSDALGANRRRATRMLGASGRLFRFRSDKACTFSVDKPEPTASAGGLTTEARLVLRPFRPMAAAVATLPFDCAGIFETNGAVAVR